MDYMLSNVTQVETIYADKQFNLAEIMSRIEEWRHCLQDLIVKYT